MEKVTLKERYCCSKTTDILRTLVEKYNGSREDLVHFENFFDWHPYTNMDARNRFYSNREIDIEGLLGKVFETAALFGPAIQDYFFACFDEDAKRENTGRRGEADYYIVRRKIEERRLNTDAQGQAPGNKPAVLEPQNFAEMFKTTDGEGQAIAALIRAGLIHEDASGWKDSRSTGAIRAVFEALCDTELICQIALTPGCKLIAKRFGVGVVKNYPLSNYTPALRQEIKAYLNYNRDNNRGGI